MERKNPTTVPEHFELGFLSVAAYEKLSHYDATFKFFMSESLDGGDFLLEGANVLGTFSKGKRAGRPRFDRRNKIRVSVSENEVAYACQRYESNTGKCFDCLGSGEQSAGWSKAHGNRYRECQRCKGEGNSPK
jgi:hypothetical protein